MRFHVYLSVYSAELCSYIKGWQIINTIYLCHFSKAFKENRFKNYLNFWLFQYLAAFQVYLVLKKNDETELHASNSLK